MVEGVETNLKRAWKVWFARERCSGEDVGKQGWEGVDAAMNEVLLKDWLMSRSIPSQFLPLSPSRVGGKTSPFYSGGAPTIPKHSSRWLTKQQ